MSQFDFDPLPLTPATADLRAGALPTSVRGTVVGANDRGEPVVAWKGAEPVAATCVYMENEPRWRGERGLPVLLSFDEGDPRRPVIIGLLAAPADCARLEKVERIESSRELVLECGKAKIAMRSDGRIEIRGGYLVSRSTGPNKIKGGTVEIN